jgi:alpha-beta hydrolase superfamily lysophospholipase
MHAVKGHGSTRPGQADELQRLVEDLAALVKIDAEGFELALLIACPDAEDESSARE